MKPHCIISNKIKIEHLEPRRLLAAGELELFTGVEVDAKEIQGAEHSLVLTLYTGADSNFGLELYKPAEIEGIDLLCDIRPGPESSNPHRLTTFGDSVLFFADDGQGIGLWSTDGTPAGTLLLHRASGGLQPYTEYIWVAGGKAFFTSSTPETGQELFVTDGSVAGTQITRDIFPGPSSGISYLHTADVWNQNLAFTANDGQHGDEIWLSNGTENGTYLACDVVEGPNGSAPTGFTAAQNHLFFLRQSLSQFWCFDGTQAQYLGNEYNSQRLDMIALGPSLLFSGVPNKLSYDLELWISDGTPNGTGILEEINPGPQGSDVGHFVNDGDRIWFSGDSGQSKQLRTLESVAEPSKVLFGSGWFIETIIPVLGGAYFLVQYYDNYRLWYSDGTAAGTHLVAPLRIQTVGDDVSFFLINNNLYFNSRGADVDAMWRVLPDHTSPTIAQFTHNVDQRTLNIRFTEHLGSSAALSDFSIVRNSDGAEFVPSGFSYDPETRVVSLSLPSDLADGNYHVTVAENSITDVAGNAFVDATNLNFFILTGDANHDRAVNFTDLLIAAQNYGQSNRTFSQGNLDYSPNGLVDFSDLLIIAQQYGRSLPPALFAPRPAIVRVSDDVLGIKTVKPGDENRLD